DYVHRIGRTARADKTGMAIAFINDRDQPKMASIERLIEREIPKENTPEGLGGSPVYAPRQKKGGGGRWRNKSKGGGGGGNGKHRPNKSRHNRNRRKKSGKGGGNRPGPSGQAPA
ncbi:MAG: ATP-dependent helicase, partial [Bacteroidota bacterium]